MIAKRFALAFGIAVILPFMVFYGVSTFSPKPKFDDYSIKNYWQKLQDATKEEKPKLEQEQEKRTADFNKLERTFERHLFWVAAPIGLAALIAGSLIIVPAIGPGLMFGGIFTFLEGVLTDWEHLPDAMKFGILAITFAVLIFIGYRKLPQSKA
jgi:hypothetical protein